MLLRIEPVELAPKWLRDATKELCPEAKFVAFCRDFNLELFYDKGNQNTFRDRKPEVIAAMQGMARDLDAEVQVFQFNGSELHQKFGYWAVGAQFSQSFYLFFV